MKLHADEFMALETARVEAKAIAASNARRGIITGPATVVVASCMGHAPCEACAREATTLFGGDHTALAAALVGRAQRNFTMMNAGHDAARAALACFDGDPGLVMFLPELRRRLAQRDSIITLTVVHAPDGGWLRGCDGHTPTELKDLFAAAARREVP